MQVALVELDALGVGGRQAAHVVQAGTVRCRMSRPRNGEGAFREIDTFVGFPQGLVVVDELEGLLEAGDGREDGGLGAVAGR